MFLRHGRTQWNDEGRFQGTSDVPLDQVGIAQAARAAEMLAVLGPSLIVSSDLSRAQDTAAPLATATGLTVRTDPGLRETFAGTWQGRARAELEAEYGPELARWARGEEIRPGGGETRSEVAARMVEAVGRALVDIQPGQTLIVVTHGGAARAAIGSMIGLVPETWAALGVLSNCAWSVLTETGWEAPHPGWRLAEYNAGSLPAPAIGDDR